MNQLYLVGIGPGDRQLITPQAVQAIENSTDIVAYSYYLKLISALCRNKICHELPLGQEMARAQMALSLASSGRKTCLVSSGDIGIYAMASLVFELFDNEAHKSTYQNLYDDIDIHIIPGITAMQAAASRSGAILGHDFCAISLSDLLTPWEIIEHRINKAAEADFVISFYNPVSKKRNWQLDTAREVLLRYRHPDTPVVLARHVTRDEEEISIITLNKLAAHQVDMFTLVSIGNSESKRVLINDKEWVYTPRGYSNREAEKTNGDTL